MPFLWVKEKDVDLTADILTNESHLKHMKKLLTYM